MAVPSHELKLQSVAFSHNGSIPRLYTCEGEDINPPLEIGNVPEQAKTLALIMEDPDAPHGTFDHWLVWNIFPNEVISELSVPGVSGTNSFGRTGYGGPCPPAGTHRYYLRAYALDTELTLPFGSDKKSLLRAMEGHILASGELMGTYTKSSKLAV
ncbi:MAG: YbhB/YbcL family Raf kinase inhibitor-like protein [Chitinophagaceae bacterium]